jgi:hypothetical protein
MPNDDPHLQTVPQQIGVNKRKLWDVTLISFTFRVLKNNFIQGNYQLMQFVVMLALF